MLGLRKNTRSMRRYIAGKAVALAVLLLNRLPSGSAQKFGQFLGVAMFRLSPTDRRRIEQHLKLIFKDKMTDSMISTTARKVCINLATSAVEAVRLRSMSKDEISDCIEDHNFSSRIEDVFARGRSMMIITAHYGNWELFAARMAQLGKLTVLARKNNNPRIEKVIHETRQLNNVRVLDRSDPAAPREMIKMGREGGHILGILMDQDTSRIQGIFSPFMGVSALTPSGPASIAIRDLYDVYVAVLHPLGDGKHEFVFDGPLQIPGLGNRETRIQATTDLFNNCLSRIILADPQHWVWNHRRWRRKPNPEAKKEGA